MFEKSFEYANLSNLTFLEKIYKEFLEDPSSVEPSWRYFFQGMEVASSLQKFPCKAPPAISSSSLRLIEHYRHYGHFKANTNPLQMPIGSELLSLEACGFSSYKLSENYDTFGLLSSPQAPLQTIVDTLEKIYCGSIGVEALHTDAKVQAFIYDKLEKAQHQINQIEILDKLNRSESFESFIHIKHPGQKRFSLEGAESLIPLIDAFLKSCCRQGVKSCFIAMAHRGRLNVLTNIMNKSYSEVFEEFMPGYIPAAAEGSGDVKYHKGYKSIFKDDLGNELTIELCPNPSHLESVDPVLEGLVKAKQTMQGSASMTVPLMIHGDAALAGQGVVYEVLQMSKIDGYSTGGTVHIVINNQIGYTATPVEGRSTLYCTDIAKCFGAPVFHVNAEDPEACVVAAKLSCEIRQKFGIDVFIDLIGYRKYGHSEGDEPSFTQPQMYEKIRKHPNVRDLYKQKLIKDNILTPELAAQLQQDFLLLLEKAQHEAACLPKKQQIVNNHQNTQDSFPVTAVSKDTLISLAERFCLIPDRYKPHPKIEKLFQERLAAVKNQQIIDWGLAEYLAYASLLVNQIPVRISGQDCRRGTFSHRHTVIVDQQTDEKYFPLAHLSSEQGLFTVYNSLLSEFGVLGFEYGYAQGIGKGLTIWEAQFGDFANSAQIILDQYISSSEQKWGVKSPITVMLPHGYEGGGPEHSSARLERYLQLCAQNNMKVVMPSCSSQVFHVLRDQAMQDNPCPLILFNPKSMLRFTPSLSALSEFTDGEFKKIILDEDHKEAKKVLLCSGKVYYDLVSERDKMNTSVAIIRLEQLYPLSQQDLRAALDIYPSMESCCFVQEEPENMGAYFHIAPLLTEILPDKIKLCYVGRARSASPAVGSLALHQIEKEKFIKEAFK